MGKKNQDQLNKYLQKEISKAQALGLDLCPIHPVVRISKSKKTFGTCTRFQTEDGIVCQIALSDFVRKLDKKEIKSILMHEVLHAQVNATGHGKVWRDGCSLVKKNYDYDGYEKYHLHKHQYSKDRAKKAYISGIYQ